MQDCEVYISNQYYEILKLSRIDLLSNKENILLHSSDGETFFVSKFIFNFLSSLANPEVDSILTPISSTHLAPICHMLNLKNDLQGDFIQLEEDFKHLGLDFRSCENLTNAVKERHDKMIKRDSDHSENQEKDVKVVNNSISFSPHEEISKEQFALVAIEEINGQNFEYNQTKSGKA